MRQPVEGEDTLCTQTVSGVYTERTGSVEGSFLREAILYFYSFLFSLVVGLIRQGPA